MAKMRVTYHNGRANKQGVYSDKHNDRNFDTEKAEHIEKEKADQNIYWHYYKESDPKLSFEQVEQKYYTEHFNNYLTARNEKSIKQGHKERVQSIEDYRKSRKSCPEETIFQVGNVNNNLVSKDELEFIFKQYLQWQRENYPQIVTLNWAYHADEQGAGHIHARQVWLAHDDTGEMVNQGKSLKEMGVERPETDKKEGRYNNAKMTYTKASREKFAEICRANGIEIEEKALEASKTGKDLIEWQTEQDKRKAEETNAELQKANAEHKEILDEIARMEIYLAEISEEAEAEKEKADKEKTRANKNKKRADTAESRAEEAERLSQTLENIEKIRRDNIIQLKAEQKETEKQLELENAKFVQLQAADAKRQQRLKDLDDKIENNKIYAKNLLEEAEQQKQNIINQARVDAEKERDTILKPIKDNIIPALMAVDTAVEQEKGVKSAVIKLWVTIKSLIQTHPQYFRGAGADQSTPPPQKTGEGR